MNEFIALCSNLQDDINAVPSNSEAIIEIKNIVGKFLMDLNEMSGIKSLDPHSTLDKCPNCHICDIAECVGCHHQFSLSR